MATITGFTSARMLAIEAASIVGGVVTAGRLILTKHDASTIDAGSVIGPQGIQGPIGEVTNAALAAQIATVNASIAAVNAVPVGTVFSTIKATAPTGYLLIDGSTIANGQTTYPNLWAIIPASWKSGSSIVLPDARGRALLGAGSGLNLTPRAVGVVITGEEVNYITMAQLPAAGVTINPPSTAVVGITGVESTTHNHAFNSVYTGLGGYTGGSELGVPSVPQLSYTGSEDQQHTHSAGSLSVDIAPFQSSNLGTGAGQTNMQPSIAFNLIIKT